MGWDSRRCNSRDAKSHDMNRSQAHPGKCPDVVLMAMSDDHGLNLIPPLAQKAGVWQDLLHAQVCEAAHIRHTRLREAAVCRQGLPHCAAYSGNMRPASMRMYRSSQPTSMQFMPISPSPPTGSTRRGGPTLGGGPGKGLCPPCELPRCSNPFDALYCRSFPGPACMAAGVMPWLHGCVAHCTSPVHFLHVGVSATTGLGMRHMEAGSIPTRHI
jgi:hypothetical protein